MQMWFFSNVNVSKLTPKPKYPRDIQVRKECQCYLCDYTIPRLMYAIEEAPKRRRHRYCKPATS